MKKLFITEKPSVARQFAEALKVSVKGQGRGYIEEGDMIFTWCVGHLVSLCYPEEYSEDLRKWDLNTLPFIPGKWKYRVIPSSESQYRVVEKLLKRPDIDIIYVATDSAREGEYIFRLVAMKAGIPDGRELKRVWIDSQTNEEILRGIREARPDSDYDNLSRAAFSRAREDYLMGINFSRALSLKYVPSLKRDLGLKKDDHITIAVGRVMTCVLGMAVRREEEIRAFRKTSFYRLGGIFSLIDSKESFAAEWKPCENERYTKADLYEMKGFLKKEKAEELRSYLSSPPHEGIVSDVKRKNEKKYAPLLFNLSELQNTCSKLFHIDPEKTLNICQELYEKRLITYPRTDARVLSEAASKEIDRNLSGLMGEERYKDIISEIFSQNLVKNIRTKRYTDNKKISDHYCLVPTGDMRNLKTLKSLEKQVFDVIAESFLSAFYPPEEILKEIFSINIKGETFEDTRKYIKKEGFLRVKRLLAPDRNISPGTENFQEKTDSLPLKLKKGDMVLLNDLQIKEGETSPPKRYTSGSMILAMENAGSLIEDEELREEIKDQGIGTSATRAGILTKLIKNSYLSLDPKTQVLSPTGLGERIAYYVKISIPHLLSPRLTASWEKGLSGIEKGTLTEEKYMEVLEKFVRDKTELIKSADTFKKDQM